MMMKRLISTVFALGTGATLLAAERVTLTITVTNTPVTGNSITVGASTRTWTNLLSSTTIVTNSLTATNNFEQGSTTNLYSHCTIYPFPGSLIPYYGSATQVVLLGQVGAVISASQVGDWCTLVLSTQTVQRAFPVTVPLGNQVTLSQATNIASQLISDLDSMSTNKFRTNSPTMASYVATNGVFYGTVSNSVRIGGTVVGLTNGVYVQPTIISPYTTNLTNYGNGITSPGTNTSNEQFGAGSNAGGEYALAVGVGAQAMGYQSTAVGSLSEATSVGAFGVALGAAASVSATNGVALGSAAIASGIDSIAIGVNAGAGGKKAVAIGNYAQAPNDYSFVIGDLTNTVTVAGNLQVGGYLTNTMATGTNQFNSAIGLSASAVDTIADGNNTIAIPDGVTFVTLTAGPTATWTNCAMSGKLWDGRLLILDNATGQSMTIAHQSGFDGTAARRIITSTAADVVTTGRRVTIWIYNATTARWLLVMGG